MIKILYGIGGMIVLLILIVLANPSASQQNTATDPVPTVATEQETVSDVVASTPSTPTPSPLGVVAKKSTLQTAPDGLYAVIKVVDGDTITISMNGVSETIRLIGINTPETVDPRKPVECFGVQASNEAKALLTGQKVRIEKDPTQGDRDKYNRLLAYIYRTDGLFINKYMVEQGYAYEYTYNLPYKYQAEFKTAENTARSQQRGLWAPGVCDQQSSSPTLTPTPTYTPPPTTTQPASPATSPTPAPNTSGYSCSANIYNCPDFTTHAQAQSVFEMCGGISHDVHGLDGDKDGQACENLP